MVFLTRVWEQEGSQRQYGPLKPPVPWPSPACQFYESGNHSLASGTEPQPLGQGLPKLPYLELLSKPHSGGVSSFMSDLGSNSALPLTGCVALGESLHLSVLLISQLKWRSGDRWEWL